MRSRFRFLTLNTNVPRLKTKRFLFVCLWFGYISEISCVLLFSSLFKVNFVLIERDPVCQGILK